MLGIEFLRGFFSMPTAIANLIMLRYENLAREDSGFGCKSPVSRQGVPQANGGIAFP
jgi:hypothetical protein